MVILGYPYVLRMFYPNYGKARQETTASSPSAGLNGTATGPSSQPAAHAAVVPLDTEDLAPLAIGLYDLEVSKTFGSVVRVRFRDHVDPVTGEPLTFLSAHTPAGGIGALRTEVNSKEEDRLTYQTRVEGGIVSSEAETPDYRISKTIDFSKSQYANKISISYTNSTSAVQRVKLGVVAGSGVLAKNAIDRQYFEVNWIGPTQVVHHKLLGEGKIKVAEGPYVAASIKDRHFSSIVKPNDPNYVPAAYGLKGDTISTLWSPLYDVAPGQTRTEEYLLYLGPNNADELHAVGLEHVVNFGKLDTICKALLGVLQVAHRVTRNYGVSIILLTIGLNLLLFPLTRASTLSMKRMQLVQPQVTKIREKYSKDAARMNKEMMDLYKKHKVNPMGGCLPMVLQMPIFISLYVAISKSPELLGAKFLWVKDLAYPDSLPLPVTLPLIGNTIHVLPLIMIVAMVAQQKISQANMASADPNVAEQQKIMAMIMPVFFGFIFYPMPSGLVIYWLTNTLTMIVVQRLLGLGKKLELTEAV